jgi:hypothetical protein
MAVLPELTEGTTDTTWWRNEGASRWRQLERDSRGEVSQAHASAWLQRARRGGPEWSDDLVQFRGLQAPERLAVIERGQALPVQIVDGEQQREVADPYRPEWIEVFSDGSVLAQRQDWEVGREHGSLLAAMQSHKLSPDQLTDQVRFLSAEEAQQLREAENWPGADRAYAIAPDTREPFMHDFARHPGDRLANVLALGSDAYNASATFAREAIKQSAGDLDSYDLKALLSELRSRHEQVEKALSGTESHLESRLQTARQSQAVSEIETMRSFSPEWEYQQIEELRTYGPELQPALELRIEALSHDPATRQETIRNLSGQYGVGNPEMELGCRIARLQGAHHQLFVEGPDPDFRPVSVTQAIEETMGMSIGQYYGVGDDDDDRDVIQQELEDDALHEAAAEAQEDPPYPRTHRDHVEYQGVNAQWECERWTETTLRAVDQDPASLRAIADEFRSKRAAIEEHLAATEESIQQRLRQLDTTKAQSADAPAPTVGGSRQRADEQKSEASTAPERDSTLADTARELKAWIDRKIEGLTRSRDAGPDR